MAGFPYQALTLHRTRVDSAHPRARMREAATISEVNDSDIEERFVEALSVIFETPPAELTRATRFSDDLHANSLRLFMIVAHMEELSGATVTYGQLKQCSSIGDAIDLLAALVERR